MKGVVYLDAVGVDASVEEEPVFGEGENMCGLSGLRDASGSLDEL